MTKKKWYPTDPTHAVNGVQLELRPAFAFELIKHHTHSLWYEPYEESSTGRQKARNLTPKEIVDRCMDIADYYVERCISRDDIHPALSAVDSAIFTRLIEHLKCRESDEIQAQALDMLPLQNVPGAE